MHVQSRSCSISSYNISILIVYVFHLVWSEGLWLPRAARKQIEVTVLSLSACFFVESKDSFMGVQVQEEVMEPAFLGSKLKKRVSFQARIW